MRTRRTLAGIAVVMIALAPALPASAQDPTPSTDTTDCGPVDGGTDESPPVDEGTVTPEPGDGGGTDGGTGEPTEEPGDEPTEDPTGEPVPEPTDEPTLEEPTDGPTEDPVDESTEDPQPGGGDDQICYRADTAAEGADDTGTYDPTIAEAGPAPAVAGVANFAG